MTGTDDPAVGPHAADEAPASWRRHVKALGTVAIALFLGALIAVDLPADRAAARDEGVHGTVTVTDEWCVGRGGCSYDGTFVSDDGRLRLEDRDIADMAGDPGDVLEAQYLASDDRVYAPGSGEWRVSGAFVLGCGAWIVGYGVWLGRDVRLRRRRGHARAARARADGVPE